MHKQQESSARTFKTRAGDSNFLKASSEFAPAGANRVQFIFSGDMRVGENTSRLANVLSERVRCGEPQSLSNKPLNGVGFV